MGTNNSDAVRKMVRRTADKYGYIDECDKKPSKPNEAMMCASKWFDGSEGE